MLSSCFLYSLRAFDYVLLARASCLHRLGSHTVCGSHILKVIIETCYLTEEEKIAMCRAVTNAGADFIKTSTGFGTGGATKEDVELFKKYIGPNVRIKAAGGVSTLEDLEMFINLGCERIGTSRAVGLCKGQATSGY